MLLENYISFETAKLLKGKGFDHPSNVFFDEKGMRWFEETLVNWNERETNEVTCPIYEEAMRWLREKHWVISIFPQSFHVDGSVNSWTYNIWADDNLEVNGYDNEENVPEFDTWEEASDDAIRYCLKNLKI